MKNTNYSKYGVSVSKDLGDICNTETKEDSIEEVKETKKVEEVKKESPKVFEVVDCGQLNIRPEANTDYAPVTTVKAGTKLTKNGDVVGEFTPIITSDGITGFAMTKYLK